MEETLLYSDNEDVFSFHLQVVQMIKFWCSEWC